MMDKREIRKQMISRRDAISESERVELSARIAERLFAMIEYKNAKQILSYVSFRSEVITDEINKRIIADGKKLYLPKTYVKEQEMRFFRVEDPKADLVSGAMGIMEPVEDFGKEYESDEDTLVIMPGVAFDDAGNRLGYGGGFYDRFLAENPGLADRTVMLAYSVQRADKIPAEKTDLKPKLLLTD